MHGFPRKSTVHTNLPKINPIHSTARRLPLQLVANYPFISNFNYFKVLRLRPIPIPTARWLFVWLWKSPTVLYSFPSPLSISVSGLPSTDISPHRCIVADLADPVDEFGVGSALAVLSHRVGVQEETINLSQGKFHGSLPEVMWILSTHLSCLLTCVFGESWAGYGYLA